MLTRTKVFALALPIIGAQAATATTGVVDTLIMGRYGTKVDLAAVAIGAIAYGFIYWGFGFLRMSTTGLTAQAGGRNDVPEMRAILWRSLLLALTLSLCIVALSPLLKVGSFAIFAGTQEVEALAGGYYTARVWGAPAYMMTLGITGWMLGTGRTGQLFILQIILNALNVALDWYFVTQLDWGPAGIGAGTAIAEWTAFFIGLAMIARHLRNPARLIDRQSLLALFGANRDIMIRTFALMVAFAWFVRSGTLISTAVTAGNEVLLQFITVSAFILDGFAFVAEKEAGEAYGARDPARLTRAMRLTSEFALGLSIIISLMFFLLGPIVLNSFIADEEARAAALAYLPYCAITPFIAAPAFQLDGMFMGTTQGKALRNAGVGILIVYVALDLLLRPWLGNTGVWLAFLIWFALRGIALGLYVPGVFRGLSQPRAQES